MESKNEFQPVVITVIDRLFKRRIAIKSAFNDLCVIQEAWRDTNSMEIKGNTNPDIPSLIVFRHIRDKVILPDYGNHTNTIYYGGKGGNDPDFSQNGYERIWRIIDEAAGHLSIDEATQLLEYFKLPFEERSDSNRPAILKKTVETLIITALSIFCQGYLLAGLAAGIIDKKDENEVKAIIGWNESLRDTFPALFQTGWEKARNPHWWFPGEKIKNLNEPNEREKIRNRYPVVEQLIEYIEKGKDIKDYKIVKKAFLELRKKR